MEISETLLGISAIYLFGRRLEDLIVGTNYEGSFGAAFGSNNLLRQQLTRTEENINNNNDPRLARIFAFSFEGIFYELPRPTILLVHGSGLDPDDPPPKNAEGKIAYRRLARGPGSSGKTGVGYQSGSFAEGTRVWIYDKGDYSLRLDVSTGPLEQILLSIESGVDGGNLASGVMARSSGGFARPSGAMARSSGWTARRGGSNE